MRPGPAELPLCRLDERDQRGYDPSSPNFSILRRLDSYRLAAGPGRGKLELMVHRPQWSLHGVDGQGSDHWRQTNNPATSAARGVQGFEAIALEGNENIEFVGLERSFTQCLMDSSVDHGHFWGCIGDSRGWTGGMVGPNRVINQTELFACRETTRSPIATPTAAPTPRPIVNTVGDCGGHHVDCGGDLGAPYQDTGITCPAAAGNRTAGANVTVRTTAGAQRCVDPAPTPAITALCAESQPRPLSSRPARTQLRHRQARRPSARPARRQPRPRPRARRARRPQCQP